MFQHPSSFLCPNSRYCHMPLPLLPPLPPLTILVYLLHPSFPPFPISTHRPLSSPHYPSPTFYLNLLLYHFPLPLSPPSPGHSVGRLQEGVKAAGEWGRQVTPRAALRPVFFVKCIEGITSRSRRGTSYMPRCHARLAPPRPASPAKHRAKRGGKE